ncbi:MAG TPA: DUF3857 domain-containing protein [Chitinophagaceae bacterium]|nr:DUF3857 domain-containing protein [Chitinophagaceae bacterium]
MRLMVLVLGLLTASPGLSQTVNEKYRKASEEMRKQVWAWENPKFRVRDIPAQYANASKVIIAHHTELTADSKSKIAFYGLGFGSKREQSITEVVREIIRINDKNAVTEYSELSFTQFAKSSGFFTSDKTTTYIGIRVTKPNGTVKEVDVDDIVLTKDESSEKRAKVAIPDLQPGDMLDYFIATEQELTNDFSTKAYRIQLYDDAPILSLSFHAALGKKYAIEYRSYNGAPELKVSKNEDKDIIVSVDKSDIPPFETALWVAPPRQLPYIRMNISLGYKGLGSKMLDLNKPGEVMKITNAEPFVEDLADYYSSLYYSNYWMKSGKAEYEQLEKLAKKKAKQMGTDFDDMRDDEKAALLYYVVRFYRILLFDMTQLSEKINIGQNTYNGLAFPLFCTMKASGLEPSIVVSEERTGNRMNEIMGAGELEATAYLPAMKKYFSLRSIFDVPFRVPAAIEGATRTKAFTFDHPMAVMSMQKMKSMTNVNPGPTVPVSKSAENARIEKLRMSLTSDRTALAVTRSTTLKGFYKADEQKRLILYEDLYEHERKAFRDEKSLIEEIEDNKKGKKVVDEVKNAFAEARKKQKQAFEQEAKEWFEQEVSELKDYRTDNLGVRHTAPDFVYSSGFNLAGMVKKAGNNIIVEIGKIQGQPLVVKDAQRKRSIDIYMPFARSIEYEIELTIPDGYTAEGVAALNTKVENETGFFITEASANEKTVSIRVRKHYLRNFEPIANWEKLMQFMDASNDWTNAKLLFKKK